MYKTLFSCPCLCFSIYCLKEMFWSSGIGFLWILMLCSSPIVYQIMCSQDLKVKISCLQIQQFLHTCTLTSAGGVLLVVTYISLHMYKYRHEHKFLFKDTDVNFPGYVYFKVSCVINWNGVPVSYILFYYRISGYLRVMFCSRILVKNRVLNIRE